MGYKTESFVGDRFPVQKPFIRDGKPVPYGNYALPAFYGEGVAIFVSLFHYFPAAPMRIWASLEFPSRMTVFSSPFRLCFRASRARVNS